MAATTAYIRKTGSDNNGGSSNGASPERTGTDGVTAGTTTFVAASGSFSSGDVDKIINIVTKGRYRITGFTNSTTVTLSGSPSSGTGLTWNLGGAVLTIGALIANANSAITNGDTVWIGAGTYRETVTVGISPTAEVIFAGDTDGSHTGDAGEVQWTAYTTNDVTAPSGTTLLSFGGKDFLTFKNITFVQGDAILITATSSTSINVTFQDCAFIAGFTGAGNVLMSVTAGFGVALNWTIDRCRFLKGSSTVINLTLTTGVGSDYDVNFLVQDCLFIGGSGASIVVGSSGTSANEGGGVDVRNCTHIGGGTLMTTSGTRISLTIPCTVNNNFIYSGGTGLSAGELGAITEDWNLIVGGASPLSNVTGGGNSIRSGAVAPLIFIGQELFYGANLRPFGMPTPASLVSWGDDGNAPSVDLFNRMRPGGGGTTLKAVGAMEYHDSAVKEVSTVRTGSNAIKIDGPGDHDFIVPVDATSTTITVYGRFDSSYAGTKPQMKVLNGGECGVADATAVMTGSADTWEQLSLTFTPTAKGIVTIRLISNTTDSAGNAFFDDFAVTGSVTPNGFDYYRRAEPFDAQTPAGSGGSVAASIFGGEVVR